jgi:hypothetical protein
VNKKKKKKDNTPVSKLQIRTLGQWQ